MEMVYTNRFDENSELSTTYLDYAKMTKDTKIKTEESFTPEKIIYLRRKLPFYWTGFDFRNVIG